MKKQGFAFSVDILLAILIALTMITTTLLLIGRTPLPDYTIQDQQAATLSVLGALSWNDTARTSLDRNLSSRLQLFVDTIASRTLCINLTFSETSGRVNQSYTTVNCSATFQKVILYRPLYHRGKIYTITAESWTR